jgi:hypothetical protein
MTRFLIGRHPEASWIKCPSCGSDILQYGRPTFGPSGLKSSPNWSCDCSVWCLIRGGV